MSGNRFVVARYRPGRMMISLALAALLIAGGLWVAFVFGKMTILLKHEATTIERDQIRDKNTQLQQQNIELREQIAILERASQIDKKAYLDVDEYLLALQSENFSLKEEVAFYRGILSSPRSNGLGIQSFQVKQGGHGALYRYTLVLTQDMKSDKVVSGTVDLSIAGEQDGLTKQLSLEDLLGEDNRVIEFQFKHFQKIEGTFSLPRGFSPRGVSVQVIGDGETVTEKTFDWPVPVS